VDDYKRSDGLQIDRVVAHATANSPSVDFAAIGNGIKLFSRYTHWHEKCSKVS
jgi:hypothetical protein